MTLFASVILTVLLFGIAPEAWPANIPQDNLPLVTGHKEQPICQVGGVVPEGWYVFAQDQAEHWKDLECPRPATLNDAHFNVWLTAPAIGTLLISCRDTPLPKGYRILEKLFKTECPLAGMNLLGEPIPNAYKLVRQEATSSTNASPGPQGGQPGESTARQKPESPQAAMEHATVGNEHFAARRYAEAEAEFREAGRLEPSSADWPALVALTLILQNQYEQAKSEAQIAVHLDPKNAMARSALAAALSGLGLWKETEVEARVSLRLDPAGGRGIPGLSQYLLGLSLWYLGKKEQGEEALREIVVKEDRYRGKLAQLLFEDGKLDDAEAQYRAALKVRPGDQFLTKGLDEVMKAKGSSQ